MPITINGSGTITGVSSLATALVNPVVTTTMGVGNATPAASGSGITFPATQSASTDVNTLDDYEEGTWTPTLVSFTQTGTSTPTGRYTKIGRIVYFSLEVSTTGTIASTINTSYFSGLPFQVAFNTTAMQGGSASWANAFKGLCLVFTTETIYPETFSAQDDTILITGFYETT